MRKPVDLSVVLAETSATASGRIDFDSLPPPAEKRRGGKPRPNPRAVAAATEEARQRVQKRAVPGVWDDADGGLLVGLYAVMHEEAYKVPALELAGDWAPASSTASRFLRDECEGVGEKAVAFVRWVWAREIRRVRGDSPSDFRISWRYQFSKKLWTDYLSARARR